MLSPAERSEIVIREVRNALAVADPDGLLELGAPADEYDDSVLRIASDLLRNAPIDPDRLFGPANEWRGRIDRNEAVESLRAIQRLLAE